jgi:hypothetical protein
MTLLFASGDAEAGRRKRQRKSLATFPADWPSAPASKYVRLDRRACLAELGRRRIVHQPVARARGVLAPVRIPAGVGGVLYRTALSRERRATNPHDVFDCRLVLALDDFSTILRHHHVEEVLIFSSWRPPSKRWPEHKLARRHPGALAVDVYRLIKRSDAPDWQPEPNEAKPDPVKADPVEAAPPKADPVKADPGKAKPEKSQPTTTPAEIAARAAKQPLKNPPGQRPVAPPPSPKAAKQLDVPAKPQARPSTKPGERRYLEVERDFNGAIGATTCGARARQPKPATVEARELHAIVCEAADARIFTSMLTPHYDRAHCNHLHLELTPKVKWRIVK